MHRMYVCVCACMYGDDSPTTQHQRKRLRTSQTTTDTIEETKCMYMYVCVYVCICKYVGICTYVCM